jgi:hypothetical protein
MHPSADKANSLVQLSVSIDPRKGVYLRNYFPLSRSRTGSARVFPRFVLMSIDLSLRTSLPTYPLIVIMPHAPARSSYVSFHTSHPRCSLDRSLQHQLVGCEGQRRAYLRGAEEPDDHAGPVPGRSRLPELQAVVSAQVGYIQCTSEVCRLRTLHLATYSCIVQNEPCCFCPYSIEPL